MSGSEGEHLAGSWNSTSRSVFTPSTHIITIIKKIIYMLKLEIMINYRIKIWPTTKANSIEAQYLTYSANSK